MYVGPRKGNILQPKVREQETKPGIRQFRAQLRRRTRIGRARFLYVVFFFLYSSDPNVLLYNGEGMFDPSDRFQPFLLGLEVGAGDHTHTVFSENPRVYAGPGCSAYTSGHYLRILLNVHARSCTAATNSETR